MAKRCEEWPILLKESRFYATVLFRRVIRIRRQPDNLFADPENSKIEFLPGDRADINIE
jgi:hypothetical protein